MELGCPRNGLNKEKCSMDLNELARKVQMLDDLEAISV
jgi:hypothetical protein